MDLTRLREALEASWQSDTAYLGVQEVGNPALGQCYPTSRVMQYFYPETEIVEGEVITPNGKIEKHFWNLLKMENKELHIDLSWQQFPCGSRVKSWKVRDRKYLNDGVETTERVERLLGRVKYYLASSKLLA